MHVSPDAEHLPASKEIIHAMGERRKHCNKYGDARADYKARRDSEPRSVGPISVGVSGFFTSFSRIKADKYQHPDRFLCGYAQ
ncbi:hypothetical protein FGF61_14855 [Citrobacter freundii]|nr:hypothetical protein FGF61_14855 [Citrobacter freundii]